MKRLLLLLLAAAAGTGFAGAASFSRLAEPIQIIRAVGPEGRGNAEATAAWRKLAAAEADGLPAILSAMDGANELALNWLRAAVDAIAAREQAAGRKLPVASLEKFLRDTKHQPRARRLAYELIACTASRRNSVLGSSRSPAMSCCALAVSVRAISS